MRAKRAIYGTALLLALILTFYFFFLPMIRKKAEFNLRLEELKGEMAAEQELHQRLQRERRMLEGNEPEYLEKYARNNFGWARDGEIVYKLEKTD